MLHKETIESRTLELLKRLQAEPLLSSFNLVGGVTMPVALPTQKPTESQNPNSTKDRM